jgi:hypothetical protein
VTDDGNIERPHHDPKVIVSGEMEMLLPRIKFSWLILERLYLFSATA